MFNIRLKVCGQYQVLRLFYESPIRLIGDLSEVKFNWLGSNNPGSTIRAEYNAGESTGPYWSNEDRLKACNKQLDHIKTELS